MNALDLWQILGGGTNSHQRKGPIRVLITFGNPLGGTIGDTAIATQHLRYLYALPHCEVTVWTTMSELWQSLGYTDVKCEPFIAGSNIANGFDLVIFDWTKIGPDLRILLKQSSAVVVLWESRSGGVSVKMKDGTCHHFALPPMMNQPNRIAELYEALGWPPMDAAPANIHRDRTIYINPFASTARKSLPVKFASMLTQLLCQAVPPDVALLFAPRPESAVNFDATYFDELEAAIATVGSRILFSSMTSLLEYIQVVRKCLCVIGADTSTQHIAGIWGTPALTFYTPSTGYHYYFWGWQKAGAYGFRLCDPANYEGLLKIVQAVICETLNGRAGNPVENVGQMSAALDLYSKTISTIAASGCADQHAVHLLSRSTKNISDLLPPSWRCHIIGELVQINDEITSHSTWQRLDAETIMRRVSDLNAIRILRTLVRVCEN